MPTKHVFSKNEGPFINRVECFLPENKKWKQLVNVSIKHIYIGVPRISFGQVCMLGQKQGYIHTIKVLKTPTFKWHGSLWTAPFPSTTHMTAIRDYSVHIPTLLSTLYYAQLFILSAYTYSNTYS